MERKEEGEKKVRESVKGKKSEKKGKRKVEEEVKGKGMRGRKKDQSGRGKR